ncbi:DNA-binding CsgD family transcriptional regulator [Litoreibacter ponti]|uniref:DNA-binding CsgD family transcriptional regulator n=1 Tax=Litoreibacter ponti TaxID=1510457 RepID=A0A2T6BEZ0_9RHOB|nr:helix-turn-helix domain-containing protein [Litoreibacter ponti]PTX54642.1 DNA-binding CsgD family transcriptional regulator [Litoreibacter ponti]
MQTVNDIGPQDLSDLIGLVYDSALEPEQWSSFQRRIHELFPGFLSMCQTLDGPKVMGIYNPGNFVEQPLQDFYETTTDEGRYVATDGITDTLRGITRNDTPAPGAPRISRNVMTDEELRNSALYKNGLRHLGCGHWTGVIFAVSGNRYAALNFLEIEDANPVPDYDGLTKLLRLLSPHIVRGARIARALYMAKEVAETYKGFLDAIALPLIIIDAGGVLQMTNAAGQRLLDRGALLASSSENRIALIDEHNDAGFRRALRGAQREGEPHGLLVDLDDEPVSLCITPFSPTMMTNLKSEKDVFDRGQLYAVFVGTKGGAAVNTGLLQDVFQLTRREADVCSALVAGRSPAQIAEIQGRAEKTIRNQIQSVHDKIGVTSTRELAEALSVFRTVGAMFDSNDPHLFGPMYAPALE